MFIAGCKDPSPSHPATASQQGKQKFQKVEHLASTSGSAPLPDTGYGKLFSPVFCLSTFAGIPCYATENHIFCSYHIMLEH